MNKQTLRNNITCNTTHNNSVTTYPKPTETNKDYTNTSGKHPISLTSPKLGHTPQHSHMAPEAHYPPDTKRLGDQFQPFNPYANRFPVHNRSQHSQSSHTFGRNPPIHLSHSSNPYSYPYSNSSYGTPAVNPNRDGVHTTDDPKDNGYNRRAAIKLILDYYNKHDTFSGSIDGDCQRHLDQFNSLCKEYQMDPLTRLRHFGHSLQHKSQAYHYYQSLVKNDSVTWTTMCQTFDNRYHSNTKRTRLSRQLKALTFKQFRHQEASDEEALKKLLAEMERLSCLANDDDQKYAGLCDIL